jgi:hypothetical protein
MAGPIFGTKWAAVSIMRHKKKKRKAEASWAEFESLLFWAEM